MITIKSNLLDKKKENLKKMFCSHSILDDNNINILETRDDEMKSKFI